jgi:hypothetical protein
MSKNIVYVEGASLTQVKSPALPLAPVEYQQKYADDLSNILRLYFNTLDAFARQFSLGSVYTVATLPDAATVTAGVRAFVTDSSVTTFNSVAAGGGASGVPVFFDGTDWRVG